MDRGCITYSVAYLAGIIAAGTFSPHLLLPFLTVLLLIPLCIIYRKRVLLFFIFSHLALFSAGAGGYYIAKEKEETPKCRIIRTLTEIAANAQDDASFYLKNFASSRDNHAILCALSIGNKMEVGKDLKNAYSNAGAMHILALSGLHVGIMYSILQTMLYPLKLFSAIRWLTDGVSILFILLYVVISGCSPSVVRAGTMIAIYKIGKISFRDIGKWDAIALSALIMGIVSPLQVGSLGFQLSYAAVIGISLLYPTCSNSFKSIFRKPERSGKFIYSIALKLWESISISICCQIATLPIILYHFGTSSQFFLITNLVAIPLATAILYILMLALTFQWIPYAGNLLSDILNLLINVMNSAITYISN